MIGRSFRFLYCLRVRNAEVTNNVVKDVIKTSPVIAKKVNVFVKDTLATQKNTEEKIVKLNVLYAQENKNGFQLINTKPEVVFILFKTNVKDVFIVKNIDGILYKNNESWIIEYYKNENLITEKYQIKF